MQSSKKSETSNPLQAALEQAFPLLKLFVTDYEDRIFVKVYVTRPTGVDELTFSTPHTVDAAQQPWQYWLHRFTAQISARLR